MGSEKVLRMGVVGLGMAGGGMVAHIASHPRTRLAGAADRIGELRARLARDFEIEVDDDVEALCRRPDIDAVYIATPHQFHKAHALIAAQHGKHILVEKPMALTLADCDAMIEAADRHKVTLIVGHTHGHDPSVRVMRQLIAGGDYGKLAMINTFNYTNFLYRPRRPEELDTAQGGGILFNQVPHQIDMVRVLDGTPVRSVRAMTGVLDPKRPTEGCFTAFLEFADGAAAVVTYSGYDHFDADEFTGWAGETGQSRQPAYGAARRTLAQLKDQEDETRARWETYGYGSGRRGRAGAAGDSGMQPHFGLLLATCERADLRQGPASILVYADDGLHEVAIEQGPGRPGRGDVINELYDAVANGVAPVHDGHFARGTVETILAIQRSAREHREIVL